MTDIRLSRFTRTDLGALTSTATVASIIARVRPPGANCRPASRPQAARLCQVVWIRWCDLTSQILILPWVHRATASGDVRDAVPP